ncbi:MAG TPA: LysM peptidoglycan-binding domain-containing protein [Candidatus Limnocylindria bacterium]|jgi:LysM repeat protein|nr:LysM peptidoglycan-binding domain-containing protein [Candidatus Limnocylindria bacterium]
MFRSVRHRLVVVFCCLLAVGFGAGCDKFRPGDTDERREANFQTAYNLGLQGLTDDAIKAYYRALEANPYNATAHRELGQLFFEKKHDYVMAVYHLRRCAQIRANRNDREANDYSIDQIIKQAQLQLAIEFTSQIGRQQAQSQVDELRRRNAELEAAVARLSQQLGQNTQAVADKHPAKPVADAPKRTVVESPHSTETAKAVSRPVETPAPAPKPAATVHTHVVKSGETPATIARQHHVTTQQLMNANKGLDPRRLRPGQSLNLPDSAR